MDKAFETKMRAKLLDMQEDVFRNLDMEREDFHAALQDLLAKDMADVGNEHLAPTIQGATGVREKARLRRVSSALYRIDAGTYGVCARCGWPISRDRLEAAPDAVMCISCRRRDEHERRT